MNCFFKVFRCSYDQHSLCTFPATMPIQVVYKIENKGKKNATYHRAHSIQHLTWKRHQALLTHEHQNI